MHNLPLRRFHYVNEDRGVYAEAIHALEYFLWRECSVSPAAAELVI